jgi:acyl carrier protein
MTVELLTPLERLRRCLPHTAAEAKPDTRIDSLAFDSMDTVEFLCAVHEEFGVRLTTADFPPDQTIRELLARLAGRSAQNLSPVHP